jgi:cyclopropane fatty-acyl-phospholipid synthase-like methyltransferase
MTTSNRAGLEAHNRAQIEYFERAGKHAMQPAATPYVQRQVDRLFAFAGLSPGERVLDVGCGMGRYTFALADRGVEVEGVDLSESLLERFRAFDAGRYNIPLHRADILDMPEASSRFTTCTISPPPSRPCELSQGPAGGSYFWSRTPSMPSTTFRCLSCPG